MKPLICQPDPWMALCLSQATDCAGAVAFGGPLHREHFAALSTPACLAPPPARLTTAALLEDPDVARFVASRRQPLLCFKPSRRLEEQAEALGVSLSAAPAAVSLGLENKLRLAELAQRAGLLVPKQGRVDRAGEQRYADLVATWGAGFVAQSPRGFAGSKTWRIEHEAQWTALQPVLGHRSARFSSFVKGVPGTVNAVVDRLGTVVVTSPIAQLTGVPWLTRHPLGSCGNDFTWRQHPDPGDAPAQMAEALGPVLAEEGFFGHFGLDFVTTEGRCLLIEVNPRLTASFAVYSAWRPVLLEAHLAAVAGTRLEARRLEPLEGGQCIAHNLNDDSAAPVKTGPEEPLLPADLAPGTTTVWPAPGPVQTDGTRGRQVFRGPGINAEGRWLPSWRPDSPQPVDLSSQI